MSSTITELANPGLVQKAAISAYLTGAASDLISSLPRPASLSAAERRGMIARYSVVLEGNFIYWMTGAHLAVRSNEARNIIVDNLMEEVRECHPGMLRRFTVAADAEPTPADVHAVQAELTQVRLFIGTLAAAPIVAMMAFFEDFIQQFMAYLADLAARQGSTEMEYTDVHGVCDVAHSQALFHALDCELALAGADEHENVFQGVDLLKTLMKKVIANPAA